MGIPKKTGEKTQESETQPARSKPTLNRGALYLCLAIFFYALWIHFNFNSYTNITVGNPSALSVSFTASTYINGIALILIALLYKRIGTHLFDSGAVVISIFLCAIGTFVAMTSGLVTLDSSLVDFAAGAMSGIGSALILCMIAQLAVAHSECLKFTPIPFIAAVTIAPILSMLPSTALLTLVILFSALSAFMAQLAFHACTIDAPVDITREDIEPIVPLIARLLAFLVILYAVIAVVNLLVLNNGAEASSTVQLVASAILLALFTATTMLRKESMVVAMYRITFLSLLVVLSCAPFTGGDLNTTYGLTTVLSTTARAFIFVVEAHVCLRANLSPLFVFGLVEAIKKIPGLVIRLIVNGAGIEIPTLSDEYTKLLIALIILSVLVYLFVLSETDIYKLTAYEMPFVEKAKEESRIEAIASERGLTARESEIFSKLCEGRNAPRIAEELYISQSTVNVHIKSIYKKCDVHSRQELLDLVK